MAEIGAGNGTGYPGTVDTGAVAETASDFVRLDWGTDMEAALVAVQAELGADPAGSFSTVVARLNQISNSTGGGVTRGTSGSRPAASAGVWYYSTDIEILEFSDGSAWIPVLAGGD